MNEACPGASRAIRARRCLVVLAKLGVGLFLVGCIPPDTSAPTEGFVEVEGGRIWYQTMGSADAIPLLVIHGGPGGRSCGYLETLAQLSESRPVIIYDQLGSGRSDRPTDIALWNVPRFVSEVSALREALGLETLHILGHSWGGSVAIDYMLTGDPTGVLSVTLAGPLVDTEMWIEDAIALRATMPEDLQAAITAGEESGDYDSREYLAATDSFYARFLVRSGWPRPDSQRCEGSGASNVAVYEYMWGPTEFTATGTLLDYSRTDRLHELGLPVMFIVGRYDEARPETMLEFQRLIPGSVVEVVEDAGHRSMEDQPELFNTAVQEFLVSAEAR